MKASLAQRLEYVRQQLLRARMDFRSTTRHLAAGDEIKIILQDVDDRLERAARVMNGSEPPVGKRNALDFDAPVADPLED